MELQTAIILAGGLGTRLSGQVPGLPKCMAPVNGQPFIRYVVEYLQAEGITRFVFALGYKAELVRHYLLTQFPTTDIVFSVEENQLGTGGALKKASALVADKNVLVLNGDTLFKVRVKELWQLHVASNAICTLALKPMENFDRFGTVEINERQQIQAFHEKKETVRGLINGGVYLLQLDAWKSQQWQEAFSFENDYLQRQYGHSKMMGLVQPGYFIDIGVPEDFLRAQKELHL